MFYWRYTVESQNVLPSNIIEIIRVCGREQRTDENTIQKRRGLNKEHTHTQTLPDRLRAVDRFGVYMFRGFVGLSR